MCNQNVFPLGHLPFGDLNEDYKFNIGPVIQDPDALLAEEIFRDQPAAAAQEENEISPKTNTTFVPIGERPMNPNGFYPKHPKDRDRMY